MTGRGERRRECAWCGLPAVGDVQVQPARFRTVSRIDAMTGRRIMGVEQLDLFASGDGRPVSVIAGEVMD